MAKQTSKINVNALFNSAEKLIAGYELTANYGKKQAKAGGGTGRKVYLIGRVLSSGNVSLVRYAFTEGKRQREATGKVLRVELDDTIKRVNQSIVREEREYCNQLEKELSITGLDFVASTRGNILLTDFLNPHPETKTDLLDSVSRLMRSLSRHVEVYDKGVLVKNISEQWVKGFVSYLKDEALCVSVKNAEARKLSQNTQHKLLTVLSVALNKAVKERRLRVNPVQYLSKKDRIKTQDHTRTFLELSELKKLIDTECVGDTQGHDIRAAFLFGCLVGLRWSDLKVLRWSDLREDENGTYISIVMVKTKDPLKTYVPTQALALLPDSKDRETIFSLPSNKTANHWLSEWVKAAGIDKVVTFHVARHSCATVLLSSGVPLQNVQAQLGHKRMSTTEIYAELVNSARKETANAMDKAVSSIF